MKVVVVIPTYNEKENVAEMAKAVLGHVPDGGEVLFVDDNSPDGTGDIIDALARQDSRIHCLHRTRKEGLGRAYVAGFKEAMRLGADKIVEMDCDFSHPVDKLDALVDADADVVIGSRYVRGGKCMGWPLTRWLVSKCGGIFIRMMTGMPIADPTGGFKCFSRKALEKIGLEKIESIGYSFQLELNYLAWKAGLRMTEIPITFTDRRTGYSKINGAIAIESLKMVFKLRRKAFVRIFDASKLLLCMALAIPVGCFLFEAVNGTTASDSSVFRYLGWRMTLGGGRCYVDAWDNTGPVLALFNAIGYYVLPIDNIGPSFVFAVLWMLTALFSYWFVRPNGRFPAAVAAFLCCMLGIGIYGGAFMNCREVVGILFGAIGSCLVFGVQNKSRYFLFGACVGFSFMNKANFVAFGGTALVLWIYDLCVARDVRLLLSRLVFAFLGFASELLIITVSYFPDGVAPMWDAALFYNLFERICNDSSWLEWWLSFVRTWSLREPGGWVLPLFVLMLVVSVYTLWKLRKLLSARLVVYLSAWLALQVLLAFAFKSFYSHYLIMVFLPIAVVLSLGQRLRNPWPSRIAILFASLLLVCSFRAGFASSLQKNRGNGEMYSWVASNMRGDDYVAAYGGHYIAEFLAVAGKKTPQRYFGPCFYLAYAGEARKAAILGELGSALNNPSVRWFVTESDWRNDRNDDLLSSVEVRSALKNYMLEKKFAKLMFFKKKGLSPADYD